MDVTIRCDLATEWYRRGWFSSGGLTQERERLMSICYRTREKVAFRTLLGNLPDSVRVDETAENTEHQKCITDGVNWVWAYTAGDGKETSFTKYGSNFADDILEAISDQIGTEIISEHHPDFDEDNDD